MFDPGTNGNVLASDELFLQKAKLYVYYQSNDKSADGMVLKLRNADENVNWDDPVFPAYAKLPTWI